jgi:uncharacterized protein (TIGR00290 family)
MQPRPKALVSWSSGKDSAFALHLVRQSGEVEIVGLVTTIAAELGRVAMHGVREALLDAQAEALGLRCWKVPVPWPCPNAIYEQEMLRVLRAARSEGITHLVFGDLFLTDLRAYREAQLTAAGIQGVFPLWMRDTRQLAQEMIDSGVRAALTCIDGKKLSPSFAGRTFDAALVAELPPDVDPCGENGEFHTFAFAGPMFRQPIGIVVGDTTERDGFVFADLLPASYPVRACGGDAAASARSA